MRDHIELEVTDADDQKRVIIITHYDVIPNRSATLETPSEGGITDIETEWSDSGKALTDDEFEVYSDYIIEAIEEDRGNHES